MQKLVSLAADLPPVQERRELVRDRHHRAFLCIPPAALGQAQPTVVQIAIRGEWAQHGVGATEPYARLL